MRVHRHTSLSYNSGRRGIVFDPGMLTAQQWKCIFPREYLKIIEHYLGENIEVIRTEIISVPAHANVQHTHRDHTVGPRVSVCIAISTDPRTNVGTLFIPGSHKNQDDSPIGVLTPSATTYLIYDTHTFHAGGGNNAGTPNNNRLFITFRASSITHRQKSALEHATGNIEYKPMTLRSILEPSPATKKTRCVVHAVTPHPTVSTKMNASLAKHPINRNTPKT